MQPPIEAVEEVRQLNRLFLDLLRTQPAAAAGRYRLTQRVAEPLRLAQPQQIDRAAQFPRALFGLHLPPESQTRSLEHPAPDAGGRVVQLVLIHSARNLARMSGYWARLLLRLDDAAVQRLRAADVEEIVAISESPDVLTVAFGVFDRVLPELLAQPRPEHWRRLLLLGFQPELLAPATSGSA